MIIYSKQKKKEDYGKKQQFYFLLGKKLTEDKVTQSMCKILYEFIFWEDNPNILYPRNTSVVSTIMNRSEQAGVIMQRSQIEQHRNRKLIENVDILELFFKVLWAYEIDDLEGSATFRSEMLGVFEVLLDEPDNMNIILEQPQFLNYFYWDGQKQARITCNETIKKTQSNIDKNDHIDFKNISEKINSSEIIKESDIRPQNNDILSSERKLSMDKFGLRIEKERVFSILQKMILHHFHRKSGDFIEQLKRYIHEDGQFLVQIIQNYLNELLGNCLIKDDHPQQFLKKFKDFVESVDQIVGFNPEISTLILQCIIKMVSKNSPSIRQVMKEMKLFEKRDSLIIRLLTCDLKGEAFIKVFEGISFESLANLKEFQDKHTLSSIMQILIENQSYFSLQMLIISVLKNPSLSEKNQKYVADLLEDPKLIAFFYPNLTKRKQSSLAKCLHSNINNSQASKRESSESADEDDEAEGEENARRSNFPPKSQSRGASFEVDFLHEFYSESRADIRKQIKLRINLNLTPVLKQYKIEEKKIKKRRDELKFKQIEVAEKDLQFSQIKISDLELEINKKIKTAFDESNKKFKEFHEFTEKNLTEGEILFKKYTVDPESIKQTVQIE